MSPIDRHPRQGGRDPMDDNDIVSSCKLVWCRTTKLSDAGSPTHPPWQRTRPARVRSSDFVRHHSVNSSLKSSFAPLHRPPPKLCPSSWKGSDSAKPLSIAP